MNVDEALRDVEAWTDETRLSGPAGIRARILAAEVRRLRQELVFAAPMFSRRELEAKLVTRDLQLATLKEQLRLAEAKRDQRLTAREELTPLVAHLLTVLESAILDLPFDAQTELDLAMLAVRTKLG